jgi:hypothetical protein
MKVEGGSDRVAPSSIESWSYAPRLFVNLGTLTERQWALKLYGIHPDLTRVQAALIDSGTLQSARMHVRGLLAEADAGGAHHNTGFVILHQGQQANWLLTHWWIQQDICCHVVSRSPLDGPIRFARVAAPLMACVWEMVVIEFERRAWVSTALQPRPDFNAYLAARLPDGTY